MRHFSQSVKWKSHLGNNMNNESHRENAKVIGKLMAITPPGRSVNSSPKIGEVAQSAGGV